MFRYQEQKKTRALSSLIIYWLHPEQQKGYKYLRRYSLDKKNDLLNCNPEPQKEYFRKHFIWPNKERFRCALIYDRRTNTCVEAYGHNGEKLDPDQFNQKY